MHVLSRALPPFQALPLRRTQRFFLARLIDRLGNFILIRGHTKEKTCLDKAGQELDKRPCRFHVRFEFNRVSLGLRFLCQCPLRKTIGKRQKNMSLITWLRALLQGSNLVKGQGLSNCTIQSYLVTTCMWISLDPNILRNLGKILYWT